MILSKDIIKDVEKYIKSGMTQEDCIEYLGIHRATFYNWRKDGLKLQKLQKEKLTEYEELLLDFIDTLKKAQVENKMRCVGIIQKAAETTWQAAAWFLERRYYEEYGRKDYLKSDVNSKNNTVIKVKLPEKLKEKDDD